MSQAPPNPNIRLSKSVIASLFFCGIGVGWLVGLNKTPGVTQTVIASLLVLMVGVTSILAGIKTEESNSGGTLRVNPLPAAIVVMALALSATAGVVVRSHNWLGLSGPKTPGKLPDNGVGLHAGGSGPFKEFVGLLQGETDETCWTTVKRTADILGQLYKDNHPAKAKFCQTVADSKYDERGDLIAEGLILTE